MFVSIFLTQGIEDSMAGPFCLGVLLVHLTHVEACWFGTRVIDHAHVA